MNMKLATYEKMIRGIVYTLLAAGVFSIYTGIFLA